MDKTQILVVGRHPQITNILLKLINQNDAWQAFAALTDEEATTLFEQKSFDLVLLSSGIEPESEQMLRTFFISKNSKINIIQHYGGGSGLLSNEILEALNHNKNLLS